MSASENPRPTSPTPCNGAAPVRRFVVEMQAGMGQMMWWVDASSADELVRRFADVEVIDPEVEPTRVHESAPVADPDDLPEALRLAAAVRDAQRSRPGFGALVGRGAVYVREPWPEGDETYLLEYDEEGWRRRQVTVLADGGYWRLDLDDFVLNTRADLWDPDLADREIAAAEFEAAWARASSLPPDWEW